MVEPQQQALSDLMDGELDADQIETVLDVLVRDEALAAEWRRMHQIRGLLSGQADAAFDVSAAVHEALASEPTYLLPGIAGPVVGRRWQRYAVGGALAASVAMATVIGLRQWPSPTSPRLAAAIPSAAERAPSVATAAESIAPAQPAMSSARTSDAPSARPYNQREIYQPVHAARVLFADPEPLSSPVPYPVFDGRLAPQR